MCGNLEHVSRILVSVGRSTSCLRGKDYISIHISISSILSTLIDQTLRYTV